MAPNVPEEKQPQGYVLEEVLHKDLKTDKNYKSEVILPQLIFHVSMHVLALYGAYLFCFEAQWKTIAWGYLIGLLSGTIGVGVGAHRMYAHRSYKATKTMEILLLAFQVMSGQNSMYTWARDHRIHHKYSDTDADPHNINRGFFFAHVGWLVTKKHPLVVEKGRKIDVSDLRSNKLLMFQRKYYIPLYIVLGLMVPILVPIYGWNESLTNAFFVAYCLRYVLVLNSTWTINSFAHNGGVKPYDGRIRASVSKVVQFTTLGDGWHNFHHSFPWDYRSTEPGQLGLTTGIIDLLARFGLLYDLRSVDETVLEGHTRKHGDGTHKIHQEENDPLGISGILSLLNYDWFAK